MLKSRIKWGSPSSEKRGGKVRIWTGMMMMPSPMEIPLVNNYDWVHKTRRWKIRVTVLTTNDQLMTAPADGTGWVGGTDDEDEAFDSDGQDDFYMGEEDFDFDGLPSLYSSSLPASYGLQLIASIFHEKKGYVDEWDMELELIRVIMETEPPEGSDYNDALNGGYSFWRWRGWLICLGAVKAYKERGHEAAVALSRNMTTRDLPECFTERPVPLASIMGEALMRNHWRTRTVGLINEWNEPGSTNRRTDLTMSSELGVRKYDTKTTMTTATKNDGVYKLELSFSTEKELPPGEKGRTRHLLRRPESSSLSTKNAKDVSPTG